MLSKLSCFVFGHHVDNHVFKQATGAARTCRCGTEYLGENRSVTHVRHTLSCFLGKHVWGKIRHPAICVISGHRIRYLTRRGGFAEYVCIDCGHPFCFAYHASHEGTVDDRAAVRPDHGGVHAVHARAS